MRNIDFEIALLSILVFLLITFFMSFFEKINDYSGTKAFMQSHFKKTFLAGKISFLLPILVIVELLAVILLLLSISNYFFSFSSFNFSRFALISCGVSLMMLLFGQRVAKDYPSSAGITIYFILVVIGFFLLGLQ
ncbi:DoxX family protein [Zunongwangia sp. HRR-M8]|uniref:DoxX family protein n=1 Tax=Zunongwangia sp. HRR-M8 TaxID=3015170 RepID=UPI0022DE83F7|nr:DoxX family protein [Zunongwangia sp. HRR-M8]WBL22384.1 DoxX family protein [Zunongwangia sp. HRR-M8]